MHLGQRVQVGRGVCTMMNSTVNKHAPCRLRFQSRLKLAPGLWKCSLLNNLPTVLILRNMQSSTGTSLFLKLVFLLKLFYGSRFGSDEIHDILVGLDPNFCSFSVLKSYVSFTTSPCFKLTGTRNL